MLTDLDILNRWCLDDSLQLMFLNGNISLSWQNCPYLFDYSINNDSWKALERYNPFKNLGIKFDFKFSVSEHIENITATACKMLGYSFVNVKTLKLL